MDDALLLVPWTGRRALFGQTSRPECSRRATSAPLSSPAVQTAAEEVLLLAGLRPGIGDIVGRIETCMRCRNVFDCALGRR